MNTFFEIHGQEITSIAVFRALKLGDILCSIPFFRALKKYYSDVPITYIGMPWAESVIFRYRHYIDHFISFPGFPGLPEQNYDPDVYRKFINEMWKNNFDLVFQIHGEGNITNFIVSQFRSKYCAGFYPRDGLSPNELTYIQYPEDEFEIRKMMLLLDHMGISDPNEELEFPIFTSDRKEFNSIKEVQNLKKNQYVCLHPGGISARRWSPLEFSRIANYLGKLGYQIVLTGNNAEKTICGEVKKNIDYQTIDLAGKTTLGALAVLLSDSCFLVSNDTGVSHLADALAIPSIIIFTSSNPDIWAPRNRNIHRIITSTGENDFGSVIQQIKLLQKSN